MRDDTMGGDDFAGRLFVHAMPMLDAEFGVRITQGTQRTPLAVVVDRSMGRPLPVGSIEPVGGMWKNARMTLSTARGLVVAVGMPAIMAALHEASPRYEPRVVLPLHDGYLGIYGRDGMVKARIMENRSRGVWEYRLFDPHEARSFESLSLALDHALGLE